MLLRPRQKILVDRSIKAMLKHQNTLAIAPTGAGKTVMFSAVAGTMLKDHHVSKALVLAHRDELTFQNRDKFHRVNGNISTSIFDAKQKSWDGDVTFAMVQTLSRPENLTTLPKLDLLVIDEAHHVKAQSYLNIIQFAKDLNPAINIYGVTATPQRGDSQSLRQVFNNVADQITISELIKSGHLVPPKTYIMDVGVSKQLQEVKQTASDYDMHEVEQIMNHRPINDAVVAHWQEKAGNRKTVIFCSTVQHAEDVLKAFHHKNISAVLLHGKLSASEREDVLDAYSNGTAQIIINVAVLIEGWDHPPTSCVVLLRPSSHHSAMIQMIGRGLRTIDAREYPDVIKNDCIVLDFGTSSITHGTLEQTIDLSEPIKAKSKPAMKDCLDCGAEIPEAAIECPLCGYAYPVFEADEETEQEEQSTIKEFSMRELDLLKKSNFLWCDVFGTDHIHVATGFNAWSALIYHEDCWYAIGGGKSNYPKLLSCGERLICAASANDYLNNQETANNAHKTKRWLYDVPSEKQLRQLPPKYRSDYSLTKYQASAMITLKYNNSAIQKIINHEQDAV